MVKYILFIDELLLDLEKSKLCCTIAHIPSSPAGYADDLATATVSKQHTDMVHLMVHEYGRKWRFKFNAAKSALKSAMERKRKLICPIRKIGSSDLVVKVSKKKTPTTM